MAKSNPPKIAFFGTPQFAVTILAELKKVGIVPALVITAPDKPQGRGLLLTAPPVKIWAQENNIKFIQPTTLKNRAIESTGGSTGESAGELALLRDESWDLFIVAAYGKIIPENLLEIPKHQTLNVHPSLLPKYRGPSPIEAAILADDPEVGVSVMRLDKEMDHGPIVAQEKIPPEKIAEKAASDTSWPIPAPILGDISAHFGGALLAKVIPAWLNGEIKEKTQKHTAATYCKKITKADGLIDLSADPRTNYLKICAYSGWPGTYFFQDHNVKDGDKKIRVSIKKATYKNNQLTIESVVPEGKSEMSYLDFLRGIK